MSSVDDPWGFTLVPFSLIDANLSASSSCLTPPTGFFSLVQRVGYQSPTYGASGSRPILLQSCLYPPPPRFTWVAYDVFFFSVHLAGSRYTDRPRLRIWKWDLKIFLFEIEMYFYQFATPIHVLDWLIYRENGVLFWSLYADLPLYSPVGEIIFLSWCSHVQNKNKTKKTPAKPCYHYLIFQA